MKNVQVLALTNESLKQVHAPCEWARAALKKAKKVIGHLKEVEQQTERELLIWLDGEDGTPLGVIVKKTRPKKFS